ncbi:hypothetical protein HanOQP8_Chr13g0501671 [Helianthus annuus]|nr:hypothetical protein HanOQP8_Chr13g0501671 [Helianthus annuus]
MKKEDVTRGLKFCGAPKKDDVMICVGNKVLPINESTTASSSSKNSNSVLDTLHEKGDKLFLE